jgi:crotonobetainyl-CoA:carnitine CoA-transferase CaiB-like acyl-CoA transferase
MSSPEKFWQGLAHAIDRPQIFQDERFATREARIEHQDDLIVILGDIFRTKPRAYWCDRLKHEDVPHSPMYDTSEALEDEQARHLQLLVSAHHPTLGEFKTVRSPVSYDGVRPLDVVPPPLLGEHSEQIRKELPQAIAARSAS